VNEHVTLKPTVDAYEVDSYAWTRSQVDLLRAGRFDSLDVENIIEEIESLGSEQVHAVESHLIKAAVHLLKLAVSEDVDPRAGWINTVNEQRRQIKRRLRKSPSLRRQVADLIVEAWPDIVDETCDGLRREAEQAHARLYPMFSDHQILDPDFFPDD